MTEPLVPPVIDVEASGLGKGSYPIEVGFVLADGQSFCTLIKPQDDWLHWDPQAQLLHGIEPHLLLEKGQDVQQVAMLLNQTLGGTTIYSDAWGNDSSWLNLLFDRGGMQLTFKIQSIRAILSEKQVEYWHLAKETVTSRLALNRHRASADALIIQQTYLESWHLAEQD